MKKYITHIVLVFPFFLSCFVWLFFPNLILGNNILPETLLKNIRVFGLWPDVYEIFLVVFAMSVPFQTAYLVCFAGRKSHDNPRLDGKSVASFFTYLLFILSIFLIIPADFPSRTKFIFIFSNPLAFTVVILLHVTAFSLAIAGLVRFFQEKLKK